MDPITHGLTGALIGKGFFAERGLPRSSADRQRFRPVVTFAAVFGSVFPDLDVVAEFFSKSDLAVLELHRNVTHSFLCLPFFAVLLAALTRFYVRRRRMEAPSWGELTLIYALGIASHILLDLSTSFGTMIWSPWNHNRASWDLVFIIDFSMTAIVLLPQAVARVYRRREQSFRRASLLWGVFTAGAAGIAALVRWAGFGFSPWVVVAASLLFAALFFLPSWRGWGFQLPRAGWCRAGLLALAAYLGLCAAAHHAALGRVQQYAASHNLRVEALGALPLPPSAVRWDGLIRTPDGVYEGRMNILSGGSAEFRFVADSPANGYLEAARKLPKVQTYLWFARFPVFRFVERDTQAVVEISDLRFFSRRGRVSSFTFRVAFDAAGQVIEQGLVLTRR